MKVRVFDGPNSRELRTILRTRELHTVCEEAHCPNIGECWERRTATFMILGRICTRACRYCAVQSGRPVGLDLGEPARVAEAVASMGLRHAVVTSVDRDDLPDGGAAVFAQTIRQIRARVPGCSVEVLIPDFLGNWEALVTVMEARPDILNHNVETVPRLYPRVRHRGQYRRSLELLRRAREHGRGLVATKSGIILGLGEEWGEILDVMADLRAEGCDVLTIGQYLQPTPKHVPVSRFYPPEEFRDLKVVGLALGFRHVESGPLVRSSYHADEQVKKE